MSAADGADNADFIAGLFWLLLLPSRGNPLATWSEAR
jgi:hypothetical protein